MPIGAVESVPAPNIYRALLTSPRRLLAVSISETTVGQAVPSMLWAGQEVSVSVISIGIDRRPLEEADPQWITQEIQGRRKDGQDVCVVVRIEAEGLNVTLSTPACAKGGGGGRAPTQRERAIFDLWREQGLDEPTFTPGAVIAFLRRLRNLM